MKYRRKQHSTVIAVMIFLQLCFLRRSSSFALISRKRNSFSNLSFVADRQGSPILKRHNQNDRKIFGGAQCHPQLEAFSFIKRCASTSAAILDDDLEEHEPIPPKVPALVHPDQLCNGTIPYPKALSPSAIMEFKKCPQSFLFQYLYGLKQPTSLVLAKGSMCHAALEKVFDLDPPDRTLEHLQNLFRSEWSRHRLSDTYRILFERDGEVPDWDLEAEREWGTSSLQLLKNYYQLEDPRQVVRPNPVKREIWLNAHLPVDPSRGITGLNSSMEQHPNDVDGGTTPTFHVRGIVDRLDMVRTRDSNSKVSLRVVDYKTGKYRSYVLLRK